MCNTAIRCIFVYMIYTVRVAEEEEAVEDADSKTSHAYCVLAKRRRALLCRQKARAYFFAVRYVIVGGGISKTAGELE